MNRTLPNCIVLEMFQFICCIRLAVIRAAVFTFLTDPEMRWMENVGPSIASVRIDPITIGDMSPKTFSF